MHEVMRTIEQMKVAEETLLGWLMGEIGEGKDCYGSHVEENGKIIDQIKDLSEASEKCMKKKYYEMLIGEIMREDPEMNELGRAGYDNWRYVSSGRFAPKGHGTNVGHGSHMRSGYGPMDPHTHPGARPFDYEDPEQYPIRGGDPFQRRMGYPEDDMMDRDYRKSGVYKKYKDAKMGYTRNHDEKEGHRMNDHIVEAVMETSEDMKEMWNDASPETRKRMKMNLTNLLKEWEKE